MGLVSKCKKMAKQAVKDAVAKAESTGPSVGPEDPEAYAAEVAETIRADVRMFSGCMDCQYSQDCPDVNEFGLTNAEGAGGACTNALLLTLEDNPGGTWLSVLKSMQSILATKKFSQVPQLSTSSQVDINDDFYLMNPAGGGKTRSLLVGINYVGHAQGELKGCHNDAIRMKAFIATHGYAGDEANCRVLMDDGVHGTPDYAGIIGGIRWLVNGAKAGDSLFMFYSGHGGSVEDTNGDEADGMDETLCPVDYPEAGQITDDEIFDELVITLPEGVTLTVVIDACHSGSVLDLPYAIKADEGTIAAVEAGERSSLISANPGLAKLLMVGKELYAMYKTGKVDVGKLGSIAKRALTS